MPLSQQHHVARKSLIAPSALPAGRTRTTNNQNKRANREDKGPSSPSSSIGVNVNIKGASINKKSPSRLLVVAEQQTAAPLSLAFSLHRPLGSPQGTVRLTLHSSAASAASSGCWAPSHPWRHIQTELLNEEENCCAAESGGRCLEFAGCRTAWEGLGSDAWDRDVVRSLRARRDEVLLQPHRGTHSIRSIRFLSGIRDDQQASLLRAIQPECVEFCGPREYGALDALTAFTIDLSVVHGAALGVAECRALARWLPTARRFRLNQTPASNVPAFVALFESLEASTALQVLEWDAARQEPDGIVTSHPQWDSAVRYLEGAVRFNALRGVAGQNGSDSGNRRPRTRPADAAADVLREWWRSTHRPPIPPPSQLSADGFPLRQGGGDDKKALGRLANAGARGPTVSSC